MLANLQNSKGPSSLKEGARYKLAVAGDRTCAGVREFATSSSTRHMQQDQSQSISGCFPGKLATAIDRLRGPRKAQLLLRHGPDAQARP